MSSQLKKILNMIFNLLVFVCFPTSGNTSGFSLWPEALKLHVVYSMHAPSTWTSTGAVYMAYVYTPSAVRSTEDFQTWSFVYTDKSQITAVTHLCTI